MKTLKVILNRRGSAVVLLAACLYSYAVAAQTTKSVPDITKSPKVEYFKDSMKDIPDEFRPFVSVPKHVAFLAAKDNPRIITSFEYWMKMMLKPQYVPDHAFVTANIWLCPASVGQRQDIAFLACQRAGRHYLVAQTGGLGGRLYVITDIDSQPQIESDAAAIGAFSRFTGDFINPDQGSSRIPDIASLREGSIYRLKAKYLQGAKSILSHADCVVSDKEIAVSLGKDDVTVASRAAHEPLQDEWFKWERGGTD